MSRSELRLDESASDPTHILEQHILAGFPPDLALDLVLNELVVRAAEATHASSAALALFRGDEMVCRAATGHLAPDLGVPLNTRDGLSGACLQTRQPQLSVDTEFDPRVDPVVSRRLGIRSILIVPVFDSSNHDQFAGILEVFSPSPAAFSHSDQVLLEAYAVECARIRQAAVELGTRKIPPAAMPEIMPLESDGSAPAFAADGKSAPRRAYEAWTLALGSLAIVAIIGVSFLFGYRFGWLRPAATGARSSAPTDAAVSEPARTKAAAPTSSVPSKAKSAPTPSADELVVYEKGKVIFRMKPVQAKSGGARQGQSGSNANGESSHGIVEAASTEKIAALTTVWLAPAQAESRLLSRTEPQYPAEAISARRSGNVVLEVQVAEDGSVASVRTLSGDPSLAAAATEAVRNWRYQPYRQHDRARRFETDVTLSFTLPN